MLDLKKQQLVTTLIPCAFRKYARPIGFASTPSNFLDGSVSRLGPKGPPTRTMHQINQQSAAEYKSLGASPPGGKTRVNPQTPADNARRMAEIEAKYGRPAAKGSYVDVGKPRTQDYVPPGYRRVASAVSASQTPAQPNNTAQTPAQPNNTAQAYSTSVSPPSILNSAPGSTLSAGLAPSNMLPMPDSYNKAHNQLYSTNQGYSPTSQSTLASPTATQLPKGNGQTLVNLGGFSHNYDPVAKPWLGQNSASGVSGSNDGTIPFTQSQIWKTLAYNKLGNNNFYPDMFKSAKNNRDQNLLGTFLLPALLLGGSGAALGTAAGGPVGGVVGGAAGTLGSALLTELAIRNRIARGLDPATGLPKKRESRPRVTEEEYQHMLNNLSRDQLMALSNMQQAWMTDKSASEKSKDEEREKFHNRRKLLHYSLPTLLGAAYGAAVVNANSLPDSSAASTLAGAALGGGIGLGGAALTAKLRDALGYESYTAIPKELTNTLTKEEEERNIKRRRLMAFGIPTLLGGGIGSLYGAAIGTEANGRNGALPGLVIGGATGAGLGFGGAALGVGLSKALGYDPYTKFPIEMARPS